MSRLRLRTPRRWRSRLAFLASAAAIVSMLTIPQSSATTADRSPRDGIPPWLPSYQTWLDDVRKAVHPAADYLATVPIGDREKPAVVLDIDNTSLATQYHFDVRTIPAIKTVEQTVRAAKNRGLAIFFITGRPEPLRELTEHNLRSVGYPFDGVALRPALSLEPLEVTKRQNREDIERRGYTILANIGNSKSDLAGGHAARTFKLPDYHGWLA